MKAIKAHRNLFLLIPHMTSVRLTFFITYVWFAATPCTLVVWRERVKGYRHHQACTLALSGVNHNQDG